MGKNKKNKKDIMDYFDLTPEEQMANADMFHRVEQGEASILDVLDFKISSSSTTTQSDYTRQIERACLGMVEEDSDASYIAEVDKVISDNSITDIITDVINEEINTDPSSDTVKLTCSSLYGEFVTEESDSINDDVTVDDTANPIIPLHFYYQPITGKMMIDDGLVSTPISVCHTSSIELDPSKIPADEETFGEMLSKIFYFIITCKHPAIIMSEDTFEIEFGMYSKVNLNKFIFFKNNGYVYGYVLKDGEADNFYSVIDIFNMNNEDILRYVVGAAFASNTMHNIFMYNDEDEVDSVMEARHSIKEFMNLVDEDDGTVYAGHNEGFRNTLDRMNVPDLQSIVFDVRNLLEDLIECDEDDEEEDDVEEEYEDFNDIYTDEIDVAYGDDFDDIDINDFPVDDMMTNTDDIDQMMEDIEPTESIINNHIEKVETNNSDGEMVLPIIHRRQ